MGESKELVRQARCKIAVEKKIDKGKGECLKGVTLNVERTRGCRRI